MNSWTRRAVLSFVVCGPLTGWGQTGAAAGAASGAGSSVEIFGATADFERSNVDRGASLGLATPPKEKDDSQKTSDKEGKGEFAIAPIPMVNPTIGNGAGAVVLYARHLGAKDESPDSTFALAGFATESGTWVLGLGAKLYLRDDRYRVLIGGGGGTFNYNFFGIGSSAGASGISIPLSQRSQAFLIEPKIRVFRRWYVGPRYHLITNDISLGDTNLDPNNLPIPLPEDRQFTTAALGIRVQRDTSDSPFYPRHGSLGDLILDFFDPAFGADRAYKNMTLSYNQYLSAGKKDVFAFHGSVCAANERTPFFDLCLLGISKDLRGYQIGQFRDHRMLVGQAEYRRELFWRIGAVAFAGAGAVGKAFDDFGDPEPGGGLGLRLLVAKKNHINLRMDYAWGNNSHAFYVSVGEAF